MNGTHASRPRLYLQEVAPRDGFQNETRFIDTADKIAVIDQLSACGYAKIEVTSFTSPKAIPACGTPRSSCKRSRATRM